MNYRLNMGATHTTVGIDTGTSTITVTVPNTETIADGLNRLADDHENKAARHERYAHACRSVANRLSEVPTTRTGARQAMATIARLLDRKEWDSDTLNAVADIIRSAGFQIRDPEEFDQ